MDKQVCGTLIAINNSFSKTFDEKGNYQIIINKQILNNYCSSNTCSNNLEKISAGCLYLLDAFFKDNSVFSSTAKSNIDIVEYIIIWLSYMLSLKQQVGKNTNLQYFYNTTINNDKYQKPITGVEQYYKNYKDLIDKKLDLINMDMSNISKIYDAFYALCMMHYEFDEESPNCGKYLGKAKEFVEKYKNLNNVSDNKDSPYNRLLYTLSNDYDSFKKNCSVKCSNLSFPTIEKPKNYVETFEKGSEKTVKDLEYHHAQNSEVASSSSSIANNLFIVLSIFGTIAFFLGISYKYSLFGVRKRFQKQKLREKIKSIKKRMNH